MGGMHFQHPSLTLFAKLIQRLVWASSLCRKRPSGAGFGQLGTKLRWRSQLVLADVPFSC
jgi:hypothetical protein